MVSSHSKTYGVEKLHSNKTSYCIVATKYEFIFSLSHFFHCLGRPFLVVSGLWVWETRLAVMVCCSWVPLIVSAVSFCMVGVCLFNNLPPLTRMLSTWVVAPEAPWWSPGSDCVLGLELFWFSILLFMGLTRVHGGVAPLIFPVVGNTSVGSSSSSSSSSSYYYYYYYYHHHHHHHYYYYYYYYYFRFLTRRVLADHFSVLQNGGLGAINLVCQVPMHQLMQ
jgi:hypothetical protein